LRSHAKAIFGMVKSFEQARDHFECK